MAEPILLVTKLHPPRVPEQTVTRERLFERLRAGRGRRLTLVACPAGFGKSTLLAAWREAEPRPLAWVTLDEGDDDAVVLWAHVLAALGLPASAPTAPLREVVLPQAINALAERGEAVLILDDFHRIGSGAALDSVAWFVEHLPENVQLVLSTRTDPALAIESLRARGELVELRADALRFTTAEAEQFINGRLELGLTRADVDLLVTRTEGWPAGLYLAALSLAGAEDRHARVAAFDGTSAHIVDYLTAEVLAAHPPELQRFMLHTAVLERLCAPLCDAVLEERGSAAMLDALARSNLFLLALDDQRRWFRFHHLFARILRVELERREPNLVPVLHRRAYAWHRASGTTDEAIRHAIAAGEHVSELIAATWVQYANAGRTATVDEWLARVPGGDDQRLEVVKAWIAALRGREAEMRAAVARVQAGGGLDAGPLADGFVSLESSLAVLRAAFGWGDVGAILTDGARSAELEPPDSPWRPVITWAVGWAHYCNGDLDAATRWLRETTRIAPPAGQWIVGVAALADLSLIAGLHGRRAEQWRLAQEALEATRTAGLIDAVEDGEVHTAYGVALLTRGRRDEALPALEKGVLLRRVWAQPLDLIDGLIALAGAVPDRARAEALFDEAASLVAACRDPGVLGARLAAARRRGGDELSRRELLVLQHLGGGHSEREIAAELYVSFNTVHSHVKSIYRKLGVASRADAVARGRADRLIT